MSFRYHSINCPLSEKNVISRILQTTLESIWDGLLQYIPLSAAPNLITLFGLLTSFSIHLILVYFTPSSSFDSVLPSSIYLLIGYLIFQYQCLDALDGRQARRTHTATPLGQIFDHICDSITNWIIALAMATTIRTGSRGDSGISTYLLLLGSIVPFFTANWEESVTHIFRYSQVSDIEGLILCSLSNVVTGIFGPDIWYTNLVPQVIVNIYPPLGNFHMVHIIIALSTLTAICAIMDTMKTVIYFTAAGHTDSDRSNRRSSLTNGTNSTISDSKAKKQPQLESLLITRTKYSFLQFLATILMSFLLIYSPDPHSNLYRLHPRFLFGLIGTLSSYQVSHLLIARMTDDPFQGCLHISSPLLFIVVFQWSQPSLTQFTPMAWINSTVMIYTYAIYVGLVYLHFVVNIVRQVAQALNVRILSIQT